MSMQAPSDMSHQCCRVVLLQMIMPCRIVSVEFESLFPILSHIVFIEPVQQ